MNDEYAKELLEVLWEIEDRLNAISERLSEIRKEIAKDKK